MKAKLLNLGVLLSSFIGYLEWGGNNSSFLIQSEYEVLSKMFVDIGSNLHPFIILPLLGQVLLIITLFQKEPSKRLTYIGLACLALLLLFMFFIGLISLNIKVLFSTLPFIIFGVLIIRHYRQLPRERIPIDS